MPFFKSTSFLPAIVNWISSPKLGSIARTGPSLYLGVDSCLRNPFRVMYTRNNRGPNTDSCGTLHFTTISSDRTVPSRTLCILPSRNEAINLRLLKLWLTMSGNEENFNEIQLVKGLAYFKVKSCYCGHWYDENLRERFNNENWYANFRSSRLRKPCYNIQNGTWLSIDCSSLRYHLRSKAILVEQYF